MNMFMGLFVGIGPYSVKNKLFLGKRIKETIQVWLQKAVTSSLNEYRSDHNKHSTLLFFFLLFCFNSKVATGAIKECLFSEIF